MKATRTLGIFAVVAMAACGGKSTGTNAPTAQAAPAPTSPPEQRAPVAVAQGPGMGLGAEAARANSTFAMFPKGANVVAGVSLAQLRRAPIWARAEQMVGSRIDSELKMFRDTCKLDPVQTVDSVQLGAAVGRDADAIVLVGGSFTRNGIAECGKAIGAQNGKSMSVTDEGGLTGYNDGSTTMWVGWPSDSQVLIADPTKHDKSWMAERVAGEASMRDDDAFIDLVGNVDTNATAWMAMHDTTGQLAMAAQFLGGAAPQGVYASARITEQMRGEIGFQFASEQDASNASQALQTLVEQAKSDPSMGGIVSDVTATAYGTNAVIEINLNREQFEQLVTMLVSMAPMLGI